jgi:hypothetical protein
LWLSFGINEGRRSLVGCWGWCPPFQAFDAFIYIRNGQTSLDVTALRARRIDLRGHQPKGEAR